MRDLRLFEEANEQKVPWTERLKLINQVFPSTVRTEWARSFDDVELFGRVLRDILKVDQAPPGRSGPRPVLDQQKAKHRLRQFMGTDYSTYPFLDTLRFLADGRSVRHLAVKTGLDRNTVQRLLSGQRPPDLYVMETIARAFERHPSFFLEYRMAYILSALGERLEASPETTVDVYRRLSDGSNRRSR